MTVRGVLCLLLIFAIAETKAFNTPSLRYVRLSHVSMAKDKVSVPYPGYGKGKRGDPLKKKKELKPIPDGYVLDEETNNARARPSELAARDEENASKEGVHRIVKLSTKERINKVLARAGVVSNPISFISIHLILFLISTGRRKRYYAPPLFVCLVKIRLLQTQSSPLLIKKESSTCPRNRESRLIPYLTH
jgi:hypothetical protein